MTPEQHKAFLWSKNPPMTATEKPNLTLYGIETQLLELLNFRESIESDPDMTSQEQAESLKACDESIAEYIRAEVKKCDGIARYLREFKVRADALEAEAARCSLMADEWKKRRKSLESMVIDILRAVPGQRIDGRHSVLKLAKNPPSVEVAQPDMVPLEYMRQTVTISSALGLRLINALQLRKETASLAIELAECKTSASEPMKSKIGEELKVGGSVPGCRLRTDGVRLEVK